MTYQTGASGTSAGPLAAISRNSRMGRLQGELMFALKRTDRATMKAWGQRSAARVVVVSGRRVGGLLGLVSALARFGGREALSFYRALRTGDGGVHTGRRAAAAIESALVIGREARVILTQVVKALAHNPREAAPKLIGALLGLGAGSGGIDGNGGLPDLDLLLGIGWHRSPITHTIIAGIVAEGLILALVDLSAEVHGRLPVDHDPLWDELARIGRPFAESASVGLSAGLAWHLLVDGLLQPGAYHGLPFKMPMEAHQTILATNGVAEANDAARRAAKGKGRKLGVLLENAPTDDGPSTGERVVAGAAEAMRAAGNHAQRTGSSFVRWVIARRSAASSDG
jgi:hypothetical protein